MPIVQHPLEALKNFIPENSFDYIVDAIHKYSIHFTVTQRRKTILGDYRHPIKNKNHRITVNGNLNVLGNTTTGEGPFFWNSGGTTR